MVRLGIRPQLTVALMATVFMGLPVLMHSSNYVVSSGQVIIQPARTRAVPVIRPQPSRSGEVLAAHTAARPDKTDCAQVACLALTFDDGPNPLTTPQVLSDLEQAHVSATFFVIGSRIAGNEAVLQRMYADGDEIGNHSWSHPDLTKLPVDQIQQQIQLTQQAVVAAGVPAPTLFRPPYGAVNQTVEDNVPFATLLWNEDPQDWAANTPQQVIQSVEASARPGGIVDMHDIYHVTADALPQILVDLQARGLHFVTVSQLLQLTPSSRGIYYGHP